MSLWDDPIAGSSPIYSDSAAYAGDQTEFNITFPESVFNQLGRVDDVWLAYRGSDDCHRLDASVYSASGAAWHPIETRPGNSPCFGDVPTRSQWLLSCFAIDPVRSFLNAERTLSLRGSLWLPRARLLRYRDDYAFIVLSPNRLPEYQSLGFDGRFIWATLGMSGGDSVFIFDTSGELSRTLLLPGIWPQGMAWSGTEYWAIRVGNPPHVIAFNGDGTLTKEFTVPVGYWDTIRGGIAWADSLIWLPRNDAQYPDDPIMKMIAVDPVASVKSGEAVIVRDLPAPADFRDMKGLAVVNGDLIAVTRGTSYRLYRMQLNGSVDEGRPLKLAAGPITWDGESVWMLHSGPTGAPTGGSLLSRFSLQ